MVRTVPSQEKAGKVNYEIMMPECGRSKVVHINLLKKWQQRDTVCTNVIEEDPIIVDYRWKGDTLRVGEQLGSRTTKPARGTAGTLPECH